MGVVDPELSNAGQQKGLEIWRIKDFGLEKVPKEHYGNFFSGDTYIVLSTVDPEQSKYNVHFWLGKDSTVDERGTAAIKTVELDDALNGHPVQHREVQEHESSLFLSYFKNGIKYLQGGAASGFNHVNEDDFDNWTPRLFQCKGKRNVRCVQVPCERESLNLGDVFILDCGCDLCVWMPPESGRLERIKGMRQAQSIRDQERCGTASINCLDEDWDSNEEFWSKMGGSEDLSDLKSANDGGDDANFWQDNKKPLVLVKVSDESGEVTAEVVSEGSFESSQLDSNEAFILNTGAGSIYVWVGKNSSANERRKSMEWAQLYLKKEGLPEWTQVVRVFEGEEPSEFMQWAAAWEKEETPRSPIRRAKLVQCNDQRGKFVAEEVANFTQEDLDGDDVMILDAHDTVYVWVGAKAKPSEKENAKALAEQYITTANIPRGGDTDIVVVDQGCEPAAFKECFPSWDNALFRSEPRSWK